MNEYPYEEEIHKGRLLHVTALDSALPFCWVVLWAVARASLCLNEIEASQHIQALYGACSFLRPFKQKETDRYTHHFLWCKRTINIFQT